MGLGKWTPAAGDPNPQGRRGMHREELERERRRGTSSGRNFVQDFFCHLRIHPGFSETNVRKSNFLQSTPKNFLRRFAPIFGKDFCLHLLRCIDRSKFGFGKTSKNGFTRFLSSRIFSRSFKRMSKMSKFQGFVQYLSRQFFPSAIVPGPLGGSGPSPPNVHFPPKHALLCTFFLHIAPPPCSWTSFRAPGRYWA